MAKTKKRRPPALRTDGLDRLDNNVLRAALMEKLTVAELNALNRQIRTAVEKACTEATEKVAENAYRQHWAIVMRVLVDRFGWGHVRIRRLWDACLDYLKDMDSGLITAQDILDTLEHDDNIKISWSVNGYDHDE